MQRTKDDPGKGSYWTIDNNYQEIALNNPVKIKQKIEPFEITGSPSDSPILNHYNQNTHSPSQSPQMNEQVKSFIKNIQMRLI